MAFVLVAATDTQPIRINAAARAVGVPRLALGPPREHRLTRATPFHGDLRALPRPHPRKFERPEREEPDPSPILLPGTTAATSPSSAAPSVATRNAPAPFPILTFDGLDFANWGAGHPPDTNGDVGPTYYIETVNTSIGIYNKFDGTRVAAFTFDAFMSQGHFGNLCDTDNFGDPVVLYDSFEDRWIITDFAFTLDSNGNVLNPPGSFQCFAVSRSGDPVSGGWNFYSINTAGGLGDYPKFGIWSDGLYMSANMFDYAASGSFQSPRVYALNKAQMYAGAATVQVVSFDAPSSDFTLLPANARLQTGTPPPGTPNFYVSTWEFLNALTVYRFHVDWDRVALSTFTGPDTPVAATSWPNASVAKAPSLNGNSLDVLQIRAMMQNQYTNIGGTESLWAAHTVRRQDTSGFAAPRWYQVNVTGGTVAASLPQATTWDPDGANVMHRFLPSLAVDRAGNMALGYNTSSSTTKPAIKYAGRLATDAVNTFGQTEQVLVQGAGTQTGTCGGSTCERWGDYSAMTLDPDGCTFWYANEYYPTDGLNDFTRIGAFTFPNCTPLANDGSLQGTVTSSAGGPIPGATVGLGSRTTTTDVNGLYSFSGLPAGTYSRLTATAGGFISSSATSIVVSENGTTTNDFSLTAAPGSACLTDTTQADFLLGAPTNSDLTSNAGDVTLLKSLLVDQQNATLGDFGTGITTTTWGGQTFTAAVSAHVTKVDINLFCSGCTGTTPSLTLSLRATNGGLPIGSDLESATIPGFSNGASAYYTATFTNPPTLTAGTMYALAIRPNSDPSAGIYALTRSGAQATGADVYPGGTRVTGATSGTGWSIPLTGGVSTDAGFRVYMNSGFVASGNFASGLKDANPSRAFAPAWSAISWNVTNPGGTTVLFQAAGSSGPNGPFNFVGPDGTAATFFASADSLAQFNGSRYLKYKAALSTSDITITPAINDVTVCFENVPVVETSVTVNAVTGIFGGMVDLSATLFANGATEPGRTLTFNLNGSSVGSALTGGDGVATLSSVSLAGLNAGTHPNAVGASFAGDFATLASSGFSQVTLSKASQAISFAPLSDKVATDAPFTVNPTGGGSGNPVGLSTGSLACSVAGNTVTLLVAGTCAIDADQQGNVNYTAAPRITQTFQVALGTQSITFPALNSFSWSGGSAALSATASSGLPVAYTVVTGRCVIAGSTLTATGTGSCTIAANQPGDARYAAAATITNAVTVEKAAQTITFPSVSSFAWTTGSTTLTASANSGLGITYTVISGPCNVTDNVLRATAAGTCVVAADQGGNDNYAPAPRVTTSVVVTDIAASSSGCGCHSAQTSGTALEMALTILAGFALRQRRRKTPRLG